MKQLLKILPGLFFSLLFLTSTGQAADNQTSSPEGSLLIAAGDGHGGGGGGGGFGGGGHAGGVAGGGREGAQGGEGREGGEEGWGGRGDHGDRFRGEFGLGVGAGWGWDWGYPYYYPYGYYGYYYPPYGYLETDVKPDLAEVWINGRYFGHAGDYTSYFSALTLPPGIYTAVFRMPGYQNFIVSFSITQGNTVDLDYSMLPLPGNPEPSKH